MRGMEWIDVKNKMPTEQDADCNEQVLVCDCIGRTKTMHWEALKDFIDEEAVVYVRYWSALTTPKEFM